MLKGKKILIGISGGISAYKICYLVRMFIKQSAEVKIIMTPSATKFVSPITLSALSKNEVIINMFPEKNDFTNAEKVETKTWHVNLGLWADVFIIAPATANTISKIAHGVSDNFLTTTVLASRCPLIICPAMDDDMYKNPATKANLAIIKSFGYEIINPVFGELASGIIGEGRMAEPEDILGFTSDLILKKSDLKGKRILITAGPTIEFLDSVRYITNSSTGKMGFEIARAARDRGADVTLISGPVALSDIDNVKRINVKTSAEMFEEVKLNLKNKDLIIMSAAVEDFKPVNTIDKKIKKENNKNFIFEFEKTADILEYIGKHKKNFKLIGFALETDNGIENAKSKLKNKNLDLIVLNNPKTKGAGFGTDTNVVTLINKNKIEEFPLMSKYDVGNIIIDNYLKMK
ncbi:MAG TPA: bifunctional phosphopantothenoylcysteine decarboxylase/phosphopantothenate--cysteine ligase CoaBC [Ignavibacteria bacterium]|nr:bifunctional phosphopantothenoylcysteine decarboxylase/phosphopantothenate--cysteine ligase CoaBC [Ignavibacteria bacterium]